MNADDFGFTRDVNEGIVEAHVSGILTATTLMANGEAFEHAVALARANPSLDVGCHLVFVQGASVADPVRRLPDTVTQLISARNPDLYGEASAQIRKLLQAGIRPTHLDTHKHTHLWPPALKAVSAVAREFGILWVRWPFDYARGRRRGITAAMGLVKPMFARSLSGLNRTDRFTGFDLTGHLDTASLVETLNHLPDGLTEFMCHPGRLTDDLRNARTRLKESRATELAALVSREARDAIERKGIELTNYLGEMRLLTRP